MVEVWDRSIEVSDAEGNSEQKKGGIILSTNCEY